MPGDASPYSTAIEQVPAQEPVSQRTSVLHRSVANPNHVSILYFDLVGHTLLGEFRSYWEQNGGLPVFGYPLSEEFGERNADLAADFTTQYFEREPFEFHPEHPAPYWGSWDGWVPRSCSSKDAAGVMRTMELTHFRAWPAMCS